MRTKHNLRGQKESYSRCLVHSPLVLLGAVFIIIATASGIVHDKQSVVTAPRPSRVHQYRRSVKLDKKTDAASPSGLQRVTKSLERAILAIDELSRMGGIYMYDSASILEEVGAQPHFYLSGGPNAKKLDYSDMYITEMTLIKLLQESGLLTKDPEAAAMFIVPQYATHESNHCRSQRGRFGNRTPKAWAQACAANVTRDYLKPLVTAVTQGRWYDRRHGADHFFIFPSDEAWKQFPGIAAMLRGGAKYFGCYGSTENAVIIPGYTSSTWGPKATLRNRLFGGGSLSDFAESLVHAGGRNVDDCSRSMNRSFAVNTRKMRRYLASFAGTVHADRAYSRGIRQDLFTLYGGGADTRIHFVQGRVPDEEYQTILTSSEFCLCPQGWAPWSPRLYDAIAAGCIPVLFEEPHFTMALPFRQYIDWNSFIVRIPAKAVNQTANLLAAVPHRKRCAMRRALSMWAPFLLWGSSPDATLMFTIASAWDGLRGQVL